MNDDTTPDPVPITSYRTLAGPGQAEIRIQRSRFVAHAFPVSTEEAAHEQLQSVSRRYHDARHVCHAWRLGSPAHIVERVNDDGEPSRTAGEPILKSIRSLDLTDTLVIVVRYFGGVKLGTGGLARAYGSAAEEALAAAPCKEVVPGRLCQCTFPYALRKSMEQLLAVHEGQLRSETYGVDVTWRFWLADPRIAGFVDDLRERSSGTVDVEIEESGTRLDDERSGG